MSTPKKARREHPNTYFVQDRSSQEELTRLHTQDRGTTTLMEGVLSEQPDPTIFQNVLDVGCGTGGWLIEVARTYPTISRLVGVDISDKMLDYARTQAEAQQVSDRVEFHIMDALRMLEFPDRSFDLINQRFGASFLRTWDWPKLLNEFQRVSKPGGVIRVTEFAAFSETASPALTRLLKLGLEALYRAGHSFSPDYDSVTKQLLHLLKQHGIQNVQTRTYTVQYHTGNPEGQFYFENIKRLFRLLVPFFRKWVRVPDDYEAIYQQAIADMEQPGFMIPGYLLTAWGTRTP